jgi:hypothetical protein
VLGSMELAAACISSKLYNKIPQYQLRHGDQARGPPGRQLPWRTSDAGPVIVEVNTGGKHAVYTCPWPLAFETNERGDKTLRAHFRHRRQVSFSQQVVSFLLDRSPQASGNRVCLARYLLLLMFL